MTTYSLVLTFVPGSRIETAFQQITNVYARTGISDRMQKLQTPAHVTLGTRVENDGVNKEKELIQSAANADIQLPNMSLEFRSATGLALPNGAMAVVARPEHNEELRRVQEAFFGVFGSGRAYDEPAAWNPHMTLAPQIKPQQLGAATILANQHLGTGIVAEVDSVQILKFADSPSGEPLPAKVIFAARTDRFPLNR